MQSPFQHSEVSYSMLNFVYDIGTWNQYYKTIFAIKQQQDFNGLF